MILYFLVRWLSRERSFLEREYEGKTPPFHTLTRVKPTYYPRRWEESVLLTLSDHSGIEIIFGIEAQGGLDPDLFDLT